MRKSVLAIITAFVLLAFAVRMSAGTVDNRGQAWLDAQKDAPVINVSGDWESDFGLMHLEQAEGSRDVTGREGKYELKGVVSGKMLYILFGTGHGTVDYCAVLSADSDKLLTGNYHYRNTRLKFGAGLCQEKGYAMEMKKQ
ncbi:MAG: hypothetical protein WAN35_00110 [Terracidiphilus sp.]